MNDFFATTVELLGQFSAHRGGIDHNIVQFILAGSTWTILLLFALYRQKRRDIRPHEKLLVWAFALGLVRESFMLFIALLQSYGILSIDVLHIFFPPLEHALLDYAMVLLCGAYLHYLLENKLIANRYLLAGITAVTCCYLTTFFWWSRHIIADPTSRFGQTWCDWIFRINSSFFIGFALVILFLKTRGWVRSTVCTALLFFFLHEFLKIPDMALGEIYEAQITPFRHGFYLLAIPIIGFIYIREQLEFQEKTEKALEKSETLYRSLIESIDYGVVLIDKNHRILMANSAQGRLFKVDPNTLIGKHCFNIFGNQDEQCHHCPGQKALTTGKVQEVETEKIRSDGSKFIIRIKAYPIFNSDRTISSFIEVTEDVTEQRIASEEMQRIRHLESVGVLAGGIAHDFNNILASIYGFTDLALLKSGKDSNIEPELSQIRKASHRGRNLVQQILTLSRKQEEERHPIRISSIIKEALKLIRSSLPSSINIQQDISSQSVVFADSTQIHQLIMNLCTNAYQAMHTSTGEISISLQDCTIEPANTLIEDFVLAPGNYVKLTVSDSGIGMDEETATRIFEPYFTTKDVGKGTGLGLAVVHGIVKSHGGRIKVHSKPGSGATFIIYLPATEEDAFIEKGAEEDLNLRGNECIIVVDDEEDIRRSVEEYLTKFGYSVDVFTNGRNAFDAIRNNPNKWDLLITDQTMPEMTGLDLVTETRKIKPDLPVVICSGYSETVNNGNIEKMAPCVFVQKPITMNQLLKTVYNELNKCT